MTLAYFEHSVDTEKFESSRIARIDFVRLAWIGAVFTLPLESFVGTPVGNVNRLLLIAAIVVSIVHVVQSGMVRSVPYFYSAAAALLVWMSLSVLWSIDPALSTARLLFVGQFIVVPLVLVAVVDARAVIALWSSYIAGTTLTAVLLALGFYGLGPATESIGASQARARLGETDPNLTADYLAISMVFLLASLVGGMRLTKAPTFRRVAPLLAIHGFGLLLTGSRGGMLALFAGVLALLLVPGFHSEGRLVTQRRRLVILGLGLAVVSGVLQNAGNQLLDRMVRLVDSGLADPTIVSRLELWGIAWDVFTKNPLLGTGFGTFAENSRLLGGDGFGAHSVLFATLADLGTIGLLLVVVFLTSSIRPMSKANVVSSYAAQRYAILATLVVAALATDLQNKKLFYLLCGLLVLHVCWSQAQAPTTEAASPATASRPYRQRSLHSRVAYASVPTSFPRARRSPLRWLTGLPDVLWILVVQLAATALNLFLHRYLALRLGESEYGRYVVALNIVLISILPGSLALPTISLRLVSGYLQAGDAWRLKRFLDSTRRLAFAASGVLMLLCLVVGFLGRSNPSIILIAPVLPIAALSALFSAQLRATGAVIASQLPTTIVVPTATLVSVFMLDATSVELSAPVITLAYLVSSLLALGLLTLGLGRWRQTLEGGPSSSPIAAGENWRRLIMPFLIIGFAQVIRVRTGVSVGSVTMSAADIALFAVALRFAQFTGFGVGSVDTWVGPMLSQAHTRGDNDRLRKVMRLSATLTLAWGLPVVTVLTVLRVPLLGLFGEGFQRASTALIVLLVGELIGTLFGSTGYFLVMTGCHTELRTIEIASACLGLGAAVVLMPSFGLIGAAVATALANITRTLATVVVVKKVAGVWPLPTTDISGADLRERLNR